MNRGEVLNSAIELGLMLRDLRITTQNHINIINILKEKIENLEKDVLVLKTKQEIKEKYNGN